MVMMHFFPQEEVEMEDIEEEAVMDIDISDKKDPLAVVEYIDDLYAYYRKAEVKIIQTRHVLNIKPYVLVSVLYDLCF